MTAETNTHSTPVAAARRLPLAIIAKKIVAKADTKEPVYIGQLVGVAIEAGTRPDPRTGESFNILFGDFRLRLADGRQENALTLDSPGMIVAPAHEAVTKNRLPVTINAHLYAVANDQSPSGYEWRIATTQQTPIALPAFEAAPQLALAAPETKAKK